MPNIKIAYAPLVALFEGNLPFDPSKPWDFAPFNSQHFCDLVGLESTEVGLSKPPVGMIGSTVGKAVSRKWEGQARKAEKYLVKIVKEYQRLYRTPGLNGKCQPFSLENFSKGVMYTERFHEEWEWLYKHAFARPGGLEDSVKRLMREHKCDEFAAYNSARSDIIYRTKGKFKESDVAFEDFRQFEKVWSSARENFGLALLGNLTGNFTMPSWIWGMLRGLCARVFENGVRRIKNSVADIAKLEEKLAQAVEAAKEKPTKATLTKAGKLCGKVHSIHQLLGLTELSIEETHARKELDALMESVGRSRDKTGKMRRTTPKHPKAHLVNAADLDAAWIAYQHAIWDPQLAATVEEIERDRAIGGNEAAAMDMPEEVNDFPSDLGVDAWKNLTPQGFKHGFGIPETGLPGTRLGSNGLPEMTFMEHQLAGIAEMVVRSFTKNDGDPDARPTILADAVGLGKTAQCIGMFQVLWHLKAIQDSNPHWPEEPDDVKAKWPPFLRDRKSFMGFGRIPSLPIVLGLPATLIRQWRGELQTWLADDTCHVLQYGASDIDYHSFLAENGPFMQAKMQAGEHWERTVILLEVSGIFPESRIVLPTPGNLKAAEPNQGDPNVVARSIFGQEFLLGVLDEAHTYRNPGPSYRALLSLMERCRQRVLITGTPVTTHPRNLLALARLARVREFTGPAGVKLSQWIESLFAEGKKELGDDDEQGALGEFLSSLQSSAVLGSPDVPSDSSQQLAHQLAENTMLDKSKYQSFWGTRKGLYALRHHLRKVIIRRDSRSRNSKGKSLLGLLDKIEITAFIKLYDATLAAIEVEADRLKAQGDSSEGLIRGFFTRLKQILVHHRLANPTEDIQSIFRTLEEYLKDPAAKIDIVLRMCRYHLGLENVDNPALYFSTDGDEIAGPELDKGRDSKEPRRRRKIVIYCHLSSSWKLLDHVLNLAGIATVKLNGKMAPSKRDEAVKSFNSEGGPDVMLLSNVGATGLNLQRGSILIFVDHPWSDTDTQQIIGRVLRRGQEEQVIVYRLVAPGTADEFLMGYAAGKKLMLQVLIETLEITGMSEENIISSFRIGNDEDEPVPRHKRSRAQGRGLKKFIDDKAEEDNERGSDDDKPKSKPKPKPGPKPKPKPKTTSAPRRAGPNARAAQDTEQRTQAAQHAPSILVESFGHRVKDSNRSKGVQGAKQRQAKQPVRLDVQQYVANLEEYRRDGSEEEAVEPRKANQMQYARENPPSQDASSQPPVKRVRPKMRPPPVDFFSPSSNPLPDIDPRVSPPRIDKGKGKGKAKAAETEDEARDVEMVPETDNEGGFEIQTDKATSLAPPELTPIQTTYLMLLNTGMISLEDAVAQLNSIGQQFPRDVLEQLQQAKGSTTTPIVGPSGSSQGPRASAAFTRVRSPPSPVVPRSPAKRQRQGTISQTTLSATSGEDTPMEAGRPPSPEWDHDEETTEEASERQAPPKIEQLVISDDSDDGPAPNQQAQRAAQSQGQRKRARPFSSSSAGPSSPSQQRRAGGSQATPSSPQPAPSSPQPAPRSSQPAPSSFPGSPTCDTISQETDPGDITTQTNRMREVMAQAMRGSGTGGRGRGKGGFSYHARGKGF